jgi:DMSO/TMAO reductase YedYZ molybdopterin-dependent catalytic subunit
VRRSDVWRGFWAGSAGGVAAVLALFGYRYATGMPTLPEALAERMIRLLPYQVFALILAKLQHQAKPLGFVLAIITSVIGFGIGGAAYARATRRSRRGRPVLALATAAVTWLLLTYVVLPLIEGGILGVPLTTVVTSPALPMALASAIYAAVLVLLAGPAGAPGASRSQPPAPSPHALRAHPGEGDAVTTRRDVLRRSAVMLVAAAVGTRWATWIGHAASRVAAAAAQAFTLLKGMPPEVTPNDQFYQVSKNFFDPTVDVAKWTLEVKGLVAKPLKLSLEALKNAGPAEERYQTFECISNEVGGDLISNARWKAVRVRDVLLLAGVKSGARTIIWHAADGYTETIPLEIAMDPVSLLAYEMNGGPIPQKHGAPVRVLLTNRYGMKQPKWLTTIEVSDREYRSTQGYWEQQGWSQDAYVKINSAFRVETTEGAALALGGWAFAGTRGISKVEFSPDGGTTWLPAAIKDPLGENTWQFWSATWTPPKSGDYTLKVRATDGKGALQPEEPKPTLPDGGQGYHTVKVHF